jgi:hypothetical protein
MAYRLYVRRYAPFAVFGGPYHGDTRTTPSSSLTDTARTIGFVTFDRTGISGSAGYSSGSSMVGPGARLGTRYGTVTVTVTRSAPTASGVSFAFSTAGANPLAPPGAPDIDTFVDLSVNWTVGRMLIDGQVRGDNFPNAEAFVLDTHGRGVIIFDFRTGGGQDSGPFTRLFGSHSKQVLGSIAASIPLDAAGNFTGVAAVPAAIHGP